MKPFFSYLRYRAAALLSLGVFGAVFALVYFLYNLPWGPAGYAALVGGTVLFLLALRDFSSYRGRCRALADELASLDAGAPALPAPANELEARYTELVEALDERRASLAFQADRRATEMQRYYTLWAHQIKTPLAAMRLMISSADPAAFGPLEDQLFSVERYVELVLQYQRLESISGDLDFVRCSLDDLARQAVRQYAPVFIRKGLSVRVEGLQVEVLTDEKWAVFVIGQLLSNAVKYTQKGGVTLTLQPGSAATLVIRDTGVGIRPEDLPRLGERGFTGENGRRDKLASGLGLFLCREVLAKLGHGFAIESRPGEGTAVKVDFARAALEIE